ncbi:MAG: tRNA (guanine(46)-N(7))-methyltransferase TrmB [Rhodospirillaceae bacterium]
MPSLPPEWEDRFHGRRKGKPLRAARQVLFDQLLPQIQVQLPDDPHALIDPKDLFATPVRETWMEIGFGGGEHLAAQWKANPEIGFLGSEVFEYGIGKMLSALVPDGWGGPGQPVPEHAPEPPGTLLLYPDDVRPLLTRLTARCLTRLFLLFPDPWPKTRHAKRRMMSQVFLDQAARLLVDGGELRVATDDPGYALWSMQHLQAHPAFAWTARQPRDWRDRPADWVETRYEAKAIQAGRAPCYLIWQRRARGSEN